ncbi:MAG: hypothetical protein PHC28_02385 [Flavobacterium sp.]|uniref:hypothetical protein n=1 Tax=Flavobacterium sp. TaxID=239 RepID=UPI00260D57DE|nr:hypothetical protein [Flavobacterium sp.]MDD5149314.1 hypothetical protein [Flavobacterium sp.]
MEIAINYQGDLGTGLAKIQIQEDANFLQLIQLFHVAIGKTATYTIQAGVPPHRHSINVTYEYLIFYGDNQIEDFKLCLNEIPICNGNTITLIVEGGGKVD